MSVVIGADVSKDEIVCAFACQTEPVTTLGNTTKELRRWLKTIPVGSSLAMESTGSYHETLLHLAHAQGLTVYLLNPRDTRHYGRSLGVRGKTDRTDAEILARYLDRERDRLHPTTPPTPSQRAAGQVLARRQTVSKVINMLRASLGSDVTPEGEEALATLVKLKKSLETKATQLVDADPERSAGRKRIETIPGVGRVISASLALALDRIPFTRAESFIAYLGLDPRPCDSGKKIGRRRLTKRGPGLLRQLLFLAAMSAKRQPEWRPLYDQYRERGLSSTATLVIIERKIARIAYSLWRTGQSYQQELVALH